MRVKAVSLSPQSEQVSVELTVSEAAYANSYYSPGPGICLESGSNLGDLSKERARSRELLLRSLSE